MTDDGATSLADFKEAQLQSARRAWLSRSWWDLKSYSKQDHTCNWRSNEIADEQSKFARKRGLSVCTRRPNIPHCIAYYSYSAVWLTVRTLHDTCVAWHLARRAGGKAQFPNNWRSFFRETLNFTFLEGRQVHLHLLLHTAPPPQHSPVECCTFCRN